MNDEYEVWWVDDTIAERVDNFFNVTEAVDLKNYLNECTTDGIKYIVVKATREEIK